MSAEERDEFEYSLQEFNLKDVLDFLIEDFKSVLDELYNDFPEEILTPCEEFRKKLQRVYKRFYPDETEVLTLDIPDDALCKLAEISLVKDITLNQLIVRSLEKYIRENNLDGDETELEYRQRNPIKSYPDIPIGP
jgi:Zn-dependent peptidase ImmA (M78 family)